MSSIVVPSSLADCTILAGIALLVDSFPLALVLRARGENLFTNSKYASFSTVSERVP